VALAFTRFQDKLIGLLPVFSVCSLSYHSTHALPAKAWPRWGRLRGHRRPGRSTLVRQPRNRVAPRAIVPPRRH